MNLATLLAKIPWWRGDVEWIISAQVFRNFFAAMLAVIVPLSLANDGYSVTQVGITLSVGSFLTTGMMIAIGFFSDRIGRRRTLLFLGLFAIIGTALMAWNGQPLLMAVAIGFTAVGSGGGAASGGSSMPSFPPTQALLADRLKPEWRNTAFVALFFLSVLAGAVGSFCATIPHTLHANGLAWSAAYRVMFIGVTVFSCFYLAVVAQIRETPRTAVRIPSLSAFKLIGKLWVTNSLTGLSWGVMGTFLTYWFHLRFGVGPLEVGTLYTISNVCVAVACVAATPLARRVGVVRTVVITRIGIVVLIGAMIWAPTFTLAGFFFLLRLATGAVSVPLRQSFVMGVSEQESRSAVAAFGNLPNQFTSSVAPSFGSVLVNSINIEAPLAVAGLSQLASGVAFFWAFRNTHPPDEAAKRGAG